MLSHQETVAKLLAVSRRLLEAIDRQDWESYREICDPSLTAFEPEAVGNLVSGLDFHRIYFDRDSCGRPRRSTISSPHVRVMGTVAVVSYVRLVQRDEADGTTSTSGCEETRVWEERDGHWWHVHFHRSSSGRMVC